MLHEAEWGGRFRKEIRYFLRTRPRRWSVTGASQSVGHLLDPCRGPFQGKTHPPASSLTAAALQRAYRAEGSQIAAEIVQRLTREARRLAFPVQLGETDGSMAQGIVSSSRRPGTRPAESGNTDRHDSGPY